MDELIIAGGWVMLPIIVASILALGIIIERGWALRRSRVIPRHLAAQVWHLLKTRKLDAAQMRTLRSGSALGRVLAAGLMQLNQDRAIMMESIEDAGRHEAHRLDRFLNTLGTVAAISPLLGLLGTVIGMMEVFNGIDVAGVGDVSALAGGISQAMITTAAGLVVAIPALIGYRYYRGQVDALVVEMEQEVLKLVEAIHGQREREGDLQLEVGA